jgi:hypothetical protein
MSLYTRPLTAILARINSANGLALVENQYTYSTPSPSTAGGGTTNTKLTITAIVPDSPYQGPVDVYYQRLDLASLVSWLPSVIRANGLTTTLDFIHYLNTTFGLNFDDTDVVNSPLTGLTDGAGSVTLQAQPNSMGWIGTGTFQVVKGNYKLEDFLTVTQFPGLMYPVRDETRPFAEAYSYWRDFTAYHDSLLALTTDSTDLTAVQQALVGVTGAAWVLAGTGRYSLEGATVVYNGVTTTDYNQAFLNVIEVQLDPTKNQGYAGNLIMHYGRDPEDYEDWGVQS